MNINIWNDRYNQKGCDKRFDFQQYSERIGQIYR